MQRALMAAALLCASLSGAGPAGPGAPKVTRADLHPLEKKFDRRLELYDVADPFFLLGTTRGVYLEGYGTVFTSEINLVTGAVMTPFRPKPTPEEIARLRKKKLDRLPMLRQAMREMLVSSATSLKSMPEAEQVVVGVSIFYYSWEDSSGLPSQVLMQAGRKSLVDFEMGRLTPEALNSALQVREF